MARHEDRDRMTLFLEAEASGAVYIIVPTEYVYRVCITHPTRGVLTRSSISRIGDDSLAQAQAAAVKFNLQRTVPESTQE